MIDRRALSDLLAPWAGGFFGAAAWYGHQQGLGMLTYYACHGANPLSVLAASVLALAVTVGAGIWSLGAWRGGEAKPEFDQRRFLALVSVMAAALFTVVIVFQTLAGLLIPGCAR